MWEAVIEAAIKASKEAGSYLLKKKIENINQRRDEAIQQAALAKDARETISKMLFERPFSVDNETDQNLVLASIIQHNDWTRRWSANVKFKDMARSKALNDIYIGLDTLLVPVSRHIDPAERCQRYSLEKMLLEEDENAIIFGPPGAGKTTSLRRLVSIFHEGHKDLRKDYLFPLVIRLREIDPQDNSPNILMRTIAKELSFNLTVNFPDNKNEDVARLFNEQIVEAKRAAFIEFIRPIKPMIFLDGLDEIGNLQSRDIIIDEIKWLSNRVPELKIFVTCRSGELEYPFRDFLEFEIAPMTWEQITQFSKKWIGDETAHINFLSEIEQSPYYDTTMKPLSLAHLCALFERTGRIPDKPKSVYRRTVRLHLEDWDLQRDIVRPTAYAEFDTDQKYEFLSNLAYYFSVVVGRYVMTSDDLQRAYKSIHRKFGLPRDEMQRVTMELESHTGLFSKIGAEEFEFSHKSLQEYLAAEHMVKQSRPPNDPNVLQSIAAEIAVSIALSSEAAGYLCDLIKNSFWDAKLPRSYYTSLLSRLALEKPDFEDTGLAFLSILLIQSLDLCKGRIPSGRRMKSDLSNIFMGKFGDLNKQSVLDASAVLEWSDPIEGAKLLRSIYSVSSHSSPTSNLTVLESNSAKRKYGSNYKTIIIPTEYYENLSNFE